MTVRWLFASGAAALGLLLAGCASEAAPAGSAGSQAAASSNAGSSTQGSGASGSPLVTKTVTVPPSSVAAPPPAPTTAAPQSDPASVVEAYFAAINARDYSQAWALGGSHLSSSYSQFAAGFANTAADDVTILSVSGNTVAVDLTATNKDGSQQMFAGTYTVSGPTITGASIAQVGSAQAGQSGNCGAPANPYGFNLCGRGTPVYNPPNNICSYFTCIDNFWNGRGYMVECQDRQYSMSGGIEGACSDHGGPAEAVYRG